MDFASQQKERGTIIGFDAETYAVYSGFPETEIIAIIQAMTDKGVIVNGKFAKWDERQPKREDDSRERVSKHRELKRNVTQCNANETQGNADVTQGNESSGDVTFLSSSVSLSSSIYDSVLPIKEEEEEDNFGKIQRLLENNGIIPNNGTGIKAINEIIAMGATHDDILAGITWLADNSGGKTMYPSSVVGPTRTAMSKRKQSKAAQSQKTKYTGPNGEVMYQ